MRSLTGNIKPRSSSPSPSVGIFGCLSHVTSSDISLFLPAPAFPVKWPSQIQSSKKLEENTIMALKKRRRQQNRRPDGVRCRMIQKTSYQGLINPNPWHGIAPYPCPMDKLKALHTEKKKNTAQSSLHISSWAKFRPVSPENNAAGANVPETQMHV